MVVLALFPRAFAIGFSPGPSRATTAAAFSTSQGSLRGQNEIRAMSDMPGLNQQRDSVTLRLCVLLQVRIRTCRQARQMSSYPATS